jgi:NRPS condensation-like uncharacterized protein
MATGVNHHQQKIYRLDNAANLYPAIRNKKRPGVFRVSASLTKPVDPPTLQIALDNTLKRIPGFSVKMRSGLFWHYFIHSNEKVLIQKDVLNPCMHMTMRSTGGFLIRVRYHQHKIALEAFHAITDGAGAMVFLKTLLAQYLTLSGFPIPATHGILDCRDRPLDEEFADRFHSFAQNSPIRKIPRSRAYHIKGTNLAHDDIKIITGTMPISALKQTAKLFNATITEFLTAAFMKVLCDHQHAQTSKLRLPVEVQVPVNLRNFSASKTLRNFSAFVTPSIDPAHGKYDFSEIVELVHHFIRFESSKKHLQSQVASNLRYAKNTLIRMLPLGLKNNLIFLGYKLMGPAFFTSTFSNLGVVKVPTEMEEHVRSFSLILGPTQGTSISASALGYKDHVRVSFSRKIKETEVEKRFFRFLVEHKIPVLVEEYPED